MLNKECESEMYVKEKEQCEMFLKHVKTKCKGEMRKYMKLKQTKKETGLENTNCNV